MNQSQDNSFHNDERWKRKEVASLEGRPFCWLKVCLQGSLFFFFFLINRLDLSCVPAPLHAAVMHLSGLHRQWNHSQTCNAYIFFSKCTGPGVGMVLWRQICPPLYQFSIAACPADWVNYSPSKPWCSGWFHTAFTQRKPTASYLCFIACLFFFFFPPQHPPLCYISVGFI